MCASGYRDLEQAKHAEPGKRHEDRNLYKALAGSGGQLLVLPSPRIVERVELDMKTQVRRDGEVPRRRDELRIFAWDEDRQR